MPECSENLRLANKEYPMICEICGQGPCRVRNGEPEAVSPSKIDSLRALRLWHWAEAMLYRHMADKSWTDEQANYRTKKADFHIKAVQTLNDFFPAGDTAEKDAGAKNA